MNNKEEVRDIAVRSISSMPLIRSMGATIQRGDRAEYESLVRISVSMNRIAVTLGSIFNALRQFMRTNDALINKQRYSDLEAMREAGRSGEGETEREPLKKALLSGVGKALLGAALIGLMGLLIPEEIKKKLKDYATNFLMEFDLIKYAVRKFEESVTMVKGFFDSLTNFFDPLKDLISELGMLVGLSLLCMRRGPTTTVPGGGRAPSGRGGGRAGMLAGVIAAIAGASAASELSEEDKSYFESIKEWVKEAMSITGDDEETQAPTEGGSTEFNSTISPNAQTAFNFFTGKGYSPEQAAGIVGNLMAESGRNLNVKAFNEDEKAYGIAQWRMDRLDGLGKLYNKDPKQTTLEEQLNYIEHELDNVSRFKGIKKQLQDSKDSNEAAQIFRDKYEVSKGPLQERQNYARQILKSRQQPAAPAAPAPASNTSNTSSNTSTNNTKSIAPAAVATPSIGTAIATQSVTNNDMKNTPAGQTTVTNMTAPATTAGAPKSQPNSKPRIPSPVFGSPELSMSLFYEPSMT
jgi:hypothetical protein